jgi:glycosyltransferase involved in cell wall biosynthesis
VTAVEWGIGYEGTFAKYRVFESYAWMHAVYGMQRGAGCADGGAFDAVIPNFFDVADFPFAEERSDDYLLYLGRIIPRKGVQVAVDLAERMGKRLLVAGAGSVDCVPPVGQVRPLGSDGGSVENLGMVSIERRGELLSRATAVLVPTQYLEPFGGVAVEAMLCGTPVLTTDWGAFTEYVDNGSNGQRCRVLRDFVAGVEWAQGLSSLQRRTIRLSAQARFGCDTVKHDYRDYFDRLATLWDAGWYAR